MMEVPEILYCDESILVCVKPAGFLSERGAGQNLPDALAAYGEVKTVHRLDKPVGGVMVLARTQDAAANLIGQIERRETEKTYLAVVRGEMKEMSGEMVNLLFHDARTNKTFVVKRERKGVREARLRYEVLGAAEIDGQRCSLVEVRLETGRTHQIRVQFASRGLPLLGDIRYGSKHPCGVSLWAYRLTFRHPSTGETVTFERRPPNEVPWSAFEEGR